MPAPRGPFISDPVIDLRILAARQSPRRHGQVRQTDARSSISRAKRPGNHAPCNHASKEPRETPPRRKPCSAAPQSTFAGQALPPAIQERQNRVASTLRPPAAFNSLAPARNPPYPTGKASCIAVPRLRKPRQQRQCKRSRGVISPTRKKPAPPIWQLPQISVVSPNILAALGPNDSAYDDIDIHIGTHCFSCCPARDPTPRPRLRAASAISVRPGRLTVQQQDLTRPRHPPPAPDYGQACQSATSSWPIAMRLLASP